MERSRNLTLTDWTKANDALNLHFEGNKSKLTKHLDMSRTTVTNFFNRQPVREAEFRKICFALRLNWQEVSTVKAIASNSNEDWIEEVRSRCCRNILNQHSTIQLINQTEVSVDQLYVDVWLLDRSPRTFQVSESTMLKSFDLRNDRIGLGDRIHRNEGIAVAKQISKLIILGKPGSGKTTFLKHLAVDCSRGKFQPDLLPVLIELRQIRSTNWQLINAISEQIGLSQNYTEILLQQGRLLILMDGLDEVPTDKLRRNVQEQVQSFSRRFGIQVQQLRYALSELDQVRKVNYDLSQDYQRKLDKILQEERNLALLGIDIIRVDEERRELVLQEFYELIDKVYSLCQYNRFILTCRTQIGIPPQGFTPVEIADFNDEQVEKFVRNWFQPSGQVRLDINNKWQVFESAIQKNLSIKELTVTPVLLSLMCLVLQDEGDIPSQIPLLYRKGIRLLLENWNELKDIPDWEVGKEAYRQLSIDQKETLLAEIAARKFENSNNFVLFEQADLAQQIVTFLKLASQRDGEAVMRAIETQHGLLVERADEIWSFSHLTFQEHLAVEWLIKLTPEQLAKKIANRRWQEVVSQFIKSQLPVSRLLRMIKRSIDYSVSDDEIQEFLTWVQTVSESKIENLNELPAARAHYFTFALTLDDTPIDLYRNFNLAHDLNRDLALNLTVDLDLTFAQALACVRDLAHDLSDAFASASSDNLDHRCVCNLAVELAEALHYVCARDLTPSSVHELTKLRLQLQDSSRNWKSFRQWWQNKKGQTSITNLRQGKIEHYDIGRRWKFTELQRRALSCYANNHHRFLVEILEESIGFDTRNQEIYTVLEEIKDNLLLPIATLRQRLPEMYGE